MEHRSRADYTGQATKPTTLVGLGPVAKLVRARLQPAARGVDFVGHVIKPWRRTTRPRTLATALQRIEHMAQADTYAAGNSYLGLVRQATHSHQERAALCRALLRRGHPVEGLGLTKALRRVRNATTTKTIATSACGVSA